MVISETCLLCWSADSVTVIVVAVLIWVQEPHKCWCLARQIHYRRWWLLSLVVLWVINKKGYVITECPTRQWGPDYQRKFLWWWNVGNNEKKIINSGTRWFSWSYSSVFWPWYKDCFFVNYFSKHFGINLPIQRKGSWNFWSKKKVLTR